MMVNVAGTVGTGRQQGRLSAATPATGLVQSRWPAIESRHLTLAPNTGLFVISKFEPHTGRSRGGAHI